MPEILPHPKRGTMEIGTERIMPVLCEFRAADGATDERPILTIVSTDDTEDRHGSYLNPNGWRTEAYMRNPVVLWQHGEPVEFPFVGKTLSMRNDGGKWVCDVEMLVNIWRHMPCNMAAFLWEAYRDHGMGAMSRAWIPLKWHDRQATKIPTFFAENVEYDDVEMTEQSFVNVPSNRNSVAIVRQIEKMRSAGKFTDTMAKILGFSISPIIIPARAAAPPAAVPLTLALIQKIGNGDALTADERATLGTASDELKALYQAVTTATPVAKRMPLPSLRLIVTNARESLRDCYPGCGPCYPSTCVEFCDQCGAPPDCCNCDETLTGDAATAEQQTIASMVDALAQELDIALAGWDSSEHGALSSWCSMRVTDCMWMIDRLLRFLDYWYPDQQPAEVPYVSGDEVRKFIAGVEASPELKQLLTERAVMQSTRVGAELSAKNQARLRAIHGNADAIVLACADMLGMNAGDDEAAADDEAPVERTFIRIKSGSPSPSRDEGAGQAIRIVSASDAPVAAAGDRSTPAVQPDLYSRDTLSVRRS